MAALHNVVLAFAISSAVGCAGGEPVEEPTVIRLSTELGVIDIALAEKAAPRTTDNFLHYVESGFYDGGSFHRAVRRDNQRRKDVLIEVVQAGIDPSRSGEQRPPIPLERTRDTKLKHVHGAVSMARSGPDTATSDFFICIGDQPSLDFGGERNADGQGFAVFGIVVRGMDVVRRIHDAQTRGERLTPPVRIEKANVVAPAAR